MHGDRAEAGTAEALHRVAQGHAFAAADAAVDVHPVNAGGRPGIGGGRLLQVEDEDAALGADAAGSMPREFSTLIANDIVKWAKITALDVLEESEIPCRWIPLVQVRGEDFEIDGKQYLSGLIRDLKDPQKNYNVWCRFFADDAKITLYWSERPGLVKLRLPKDWPGASPRATCPRSWQKPRCTRSTWGLCSRAPNTGAISNNV